MFSVVIRELRLSSHMTQKELAEAVFISPGAISQYEKGKSMPSRETLDRLAKYFSVSVDYLLGTSANADIEVLMNKIYCGDMKVSDFLKLCMEVAPENRDLLLRMIQILANQKSPAGVK